jgi:ferredoxin
MTILYFTGTGNSLAVAKRIGASCGGETAKLISIPQCIKSGDYAYSDEVIGLVFPTYCCYFPRIVREFLPKAKLAASYLFAVSTYGNGMGRGGDGGEMIEFERYASGLELKMDYCNSILMVDNFLDAFDIGREIERVPSKRIDEHIERIAADIGARRKYVKRAGVIGKALTRMCMPLVKAQDRGETCKKFSIDERCNACGTCAQVCPRGNVAVSEAPRFGRNCEGCYACVHACPRKAIHLKAEKNDLRWRNPDVSLREIVEANAR